MPASTLIPRTIPGSSRHSSSARRRAKGAIAADSGVVVSIGPYDTRVSAHSIKTGKLLWTGPEIYRGGTVVATGTPEQVARVEGSYTGMFLAEIFDGK